MSKLNKDKREAIIANAIAKSPVPARFAAYGKRHDAWVEKCRIESLGGAKEVSRIEKVIQKAAKVLAEVPEHLLSSRSQLATDYEIYLNVAGCAYHAYFPQVEGGERLRKPCVNGASNKRFVLEADHPLAVEFFELEEERKTIGAIEESIRTQARATVYSCTTVKGLLGVWPEAVELLPSSDAIVAAGLPSVDVRELNTLIGLPTE